MHFSASTFIAPYLHQFSVGVHFIGAILDKFALHLVKFLKNDGFFNFNADLMHIFKKQIDFGENFFLLKNLWSPMDELMII